MVGRDLGSFPYAVPAKLHNDLRNKHCFHIPDRETKL